MRRLYMGVALTLALVAARLPADEEQASAAVGPGKAVLEVSKDNAFRLSDAAVKRMGVRFVKFPGGAVVTLPTSALIDYQAETGIYRLRDGWLKRVDVSTIKRTETQADVKAAALAAGDRVVVAGTALVRVAELDIAGGGESAH